MKLKKILFGVLTIAASAMLSVGIAACDDKDESSSVGAGSAVASSIVQNSSNAQNDGSSSATNVENEDKIRFKTFTVDGENVVAPSFSNATEKFSFLEEIEVWGNADFAVADDEFGKQTYLTKTVPLSVGDNLFYVFETRNGKVSKVYTVTLRRRPMYEVTFNPNGGTAVEGQTIEEGYCASAPTTATTRVGYTFDKWDYDFTQPITGYTSINAVWTANDDTPYKVEYYLQNLEDYGYTLKTTENKTGTTDATATAEIKKFEHFTYKASMTDSGNINGDGTTVLKVYYTRDTYTVTFDGNGGMLASGSDSQTVKYGGTVVAPTYAKTGYSVDTWDKPLTNISEDQTITAQWKINQYTLTLKCNNGEEDILLTYDYNAPIGYTLPTDLERGGYGFVGWDNILPTTMPAENMTLNAKWSAIFTYADGTITDLRYYGEDNITELKIPAEIDGKKITAIGDSAFQYCSSLTSVVIGDGVTSIGERAFWSCSSLTSVVIPDGVMYIGDYAFTWCSCLKEVYYNGTKNDWNQIYIGSWNSDLTSAARYYYSEEEPTGEDNYWHYVDGVVTKW